MAAICSMVSSLNVPEKTSSGGMLAMLDVLVPSAVRHRSRGSSAGHGSATGVQGGALGEAGSPGRDGRLDHVGWVSAEPVRAEDFTWQQVSLEGVRSGELLRGPACGCASA